MDAWYAKNWIDKLKIWFMPTGWRPNDIIERFPRDIIKDVYSQKKYVTKEGFENKLWAIFQFIGINITLYYFLTFFSDLNPVNRIEIGVVIMLNIFGFTTVMDGHRWSKLFEILRCTSALIYFTLPFQWNLYVDFSQIFLYFILKHI